jgi:hypothetical protein
MSATFLAAMRLAAVGTTIDVASASSTTIAEAVEDALKVPVPPALSGVLPRPSMRAAGRFVASLLARADVALLRGTFDDDWFRNPRGLLHLREIDAGPRPAKLPTESLRGSAELLAQALEAGAG